MKTPFAPLERELVKQIYQALQEPVVETILKIAKDGFGDDYWRSRMEGHGMKVDKDILKQNHEIELSDVETFKRDSQKGKTGILISHFAFRILRNELD